MVEETRKDPYVYYDRFQTGIKHKRQLRYLLDSLRYYGEILDVGQRNPFTGLMEYYFYVKIDNTEGDLDESFTSPKGYYRTIIYSHTIEHQFNPLYTLLELKKLMDYKSEIYIFLPRRPKFLWTKGHFHEIDHYRMMLLVERAGLVVKEYRLFKEWRNPVRYLFGLRMFLRLFFEFNAVYRITK